MGVAVRLKEKSVLVVVLFLRRLTMFAIIVNNLCGVKLCHVMSFWVRRAMPLLLKLVVAFSALLLLHVYFLMSYTN